MLARALTCARSLRVVGLLQFACQFIVLAFKHSNRNRSIRQRESRRSDSSAQGTMSSQSASGEKRQKIAVFNSTGRHAGSVICALREQNRFDVRALVPVGTKDPKVQELKDLGMEVLEGICEYIYYYWYFL